MSAPVAINCDQQLINSARTLIDQFILDPETDQLEAAEKTACKIRDTSIGVNLIIEIAAVLTATEQFDRAILTLSKFKFNYGPDLYIKNQKNIELILDRIIDSGDYSKIKLFSSTFNESDQTSISKYLHSIVIRENRSRESFYIAVEIPNQAIQDQTMKEFGSKT
jgi:hypothetical protein